MPVSSVQRPILGLMTPESRQAPFAEYVNGKWRIWLSFNSKATAGTYLVLHSHNPLDQRMNGKVERFTVGEDGTIHSSQIIFDASATNLVTGKGPQ